MPRSPRWRWPKCEEHGSHLHRRVVSRERWLPRRRTTSSPTHSGIVDHIPTTVRTDVADLNELTESHLALARENENGRSAELVAHDGELRQTVIALADGVRLPAHNSPPAASIQGLVGPIRVELDKEMQGEVGAGELWILTLDRRSVLALEDCVFLPTTVTSVDKPSYSLPTPRDRGRAPSAGRTRGWRGSLTSRRSG